MTGIVLFFLVIAIFFDHNASTGIMGGDGKSPYSFTVKINVCYLWLCCVFVFLLVAFRNVNVGSDTLGYCDYFSNSVDLNFGSREYGFSFFTYCIRFFTDNVHVFLGIMAIPFPMAFYYLLKDKLHSCIDIYIALLIMMSLGILTFSMSGLRQMIAISFTIFAYLQLDKGKEIYFFIIVLCASLFHISALFFLIVLLIRSKKISIMHLAFFIMIFLVVNVFPQYIINIIQFFSFWDIYSSYGATYESSLSYSMLAIQTIMFLTALIFNRDINSQKGTIFLLNSTFLSLIFQSCAGVIAEFFRLALYFSVLFCLLIPLSFDSMKNKKWEFLLKLISIILMTVYLIFLNNPLEGYQIL